MVDTKHRSAPARPGRAGSCLARNDRTFADRTDRRGGAFARDRRRSRVVPDFRRLRCAQIGDGHSAPCRPTTEYGDPDLRAGGHRPGDPARTRESSACARTCGRRRKPWSPSNRVCAALHEPRRCRFEPGGIPDRRRARLPERSLARGNESWKRGRSSRRPSGSSRPGTRARPSSSRPAPGRIAAALNAEAEARREHPWDPLHQRPAGQSPRGPLHEKTGSSTSSSARPPSSRNGKDGEWVLVLTPSGQAGWVHRSLLRDSWSSSSDTTMQSLPASLAR